jgi:hypothetical protein
MRTRASAPFIVVNWFSTGVVFVRVRFEYTEAGWPANLVTLGPGATLAPPIGGLHRRLVRIQWAGYPLSPVSRNRTTKGSFR